MIKTFESQLQIYREVTVDAAILDDPESAPETIDRVLRNVVKWKRPGYLEIPRDRVRVPVASPAGRLELDPSTDDSSILAGALDEATAEIAAMLAAARRPALLRRRRVRRHGLTDAVVRLAERLRLPVVTDLLGKAVVSREPPSVCRRLHGCSGRPDRPRADSTTPTACWGSAWC